LFSIEQNYTTTPPPTPIFKLNFNPISEDMSNAFIKLTAKKKKEKEKKKQTNKQITKKRKIDRKKETMK
jgi:hypothetical protein